MTAGRPAVSCVVIARDAERSIGMTLASAAFCPERLVLDSGSVDATVAIALAAGARVEHQPFLGYGLQKRRAVELAAHDWILSLDADESLDPEAAAAVQHLELTDPDACYAFQRRTFIGTREVRHGPWGGERVVRLFHRGRAGFSTLPVHERVEPRTPPRLLPGSILHHSFTDGADVLARSIRYARLKAGLMRSRGEGAAAWALPLRGVATFMKSYVVQGGWRDGTAGFVVAVSRVIDSTLPRALLLLDDVRDDAPPPPR
ncbi:MAG: glycosyltransferase family 2 protein [Planctomycetia bacterium]|nr:glycosyltransferase family 2 protein [Planctomycetia bacterium]